MLPYVHMTYAYSFHMFMSFISYDHMAKRSHYCICHWTLFLLVFFVHFRPNFTSHSLPIFLPYVYPCYVLSFYALMLTNKQQEHNSIGTTGHRTTHLLGYRHSETVLLWFLTRILRWNLLCRHQTLPPLKVPDFPDTEHE